MSTRASFEHLCAVAIVLTSTLVLPAVARTYVDFDPDWRFSKGDFAMATMPAFDDSSWRTVNLPHDWSIEGPFGPDYGSGNGFAPGGIGWYRKHFTLDEAHKGKAVVIEFDGVYCCGEVWINGQFVGGRPYGYSSFECGLTPLVKFGKDENVLAVRVDHSRFADSRWYTGSGIYRHVRLRITGKLAIAHGGTYITTPQVTKDSAIVRVETIVHNAYGQTKPFSLSLEVIGPDGKGAGTATTEAGSDRILIQQITISRPSLWSTESPNLYTLKSRVSVDSQVVDETETPFGIRAIRFDPDKGCFLNGRPLKLKGVCIHHDAGCVGAAVPDKILERRLRTLKEIGVNAIRTSHNPPAPELLDLCDRLGLLVMDEAFDEFTPAKNKWVTGRNVGLPSRFGYAEFFAEWSVHDIQDMVRRDRNHPCVILWSIGNEIDYANDPFSHPVLGNEYRPENPPAENLVKYAKPLVEVVKKWDQTRPVTMALANIRMSNAVGLPELLDVVGYNYQEQYYQADHQTYPRRFIYGSENGDAYSAWLAVRDNDYVAGQFLWTGIDYLGEASRFPNRANGTGLLDMCGFKKPLAWFRQSLWSDEPMVYVCASARGGGRGRGMRGRESWNWPEGATVTVVGYTNCPEVALTLNDKLVGTRSLSEARQGALMWQVPYEPGILRAVGRTDGKDACEFTLRTAGAAKRITLSPDAVRLTADGRDICHLAFQITDAGGVRVPDADHEVTFDVDGPAEIIGIENGDLSSLEDPKDHVHKAYQGQGLAILQSARQAGRVRVTARAEGLEAASVEIAVEPGADTR
jgi:beta-galactosidase